ncbi:MAG: DinB family protein [Candidatus Promineifilaceae bacterium]|nr:DinB family protein [Candidatus Promineifilaceae bacterium]
MSEQQKRLLALEPLPNYSETVGRWLRALENVRRRTKETLEGLHPQVVDWAPEGGANTIGSLLYHIAIVEADWLYVEVLEQPFPADVQKWLDRPMRNEQGRLFPAEGESLEEHIARLDAIRARLMEAFRELTDVDFRRTRHFEQYEVTPEWVLYHLSQHEAEHRGQIGELRAWAERALDL